MRDNGILHETGDRWKLDTLIPAKDRVLVSAQIQRTSLLKTSTKPVLVYDSINPERMQHMPIHTARETGIEEQDRLRRRYSGDMPVTGDRLI